jgi:hypothetical protein
LAEAAHLGCVIGNLVLITAFPFQLFSFSAFQLFSFSPFVPFLLSAFYFLLFPCRFLLFKLEVNYPRRAQLHFDPPV